MGTTTLRWAAASSQWKVAGIVVLVCGVCAYPFIKQHYAGYQVIDGAEVRKREMRQERMKWMKSDEMPRS